MLLFVDKLTNVDFSFLDPQRGLLGETYLANILLKGDLDEQGMVCDFSTVKKIVRHWLDTELDHRLAVPIRSPNITLVDEGEFLNIHWKFSNEGQFGNNDQFLQTRSPRNAIALVDAEVLTPETIAQWCIAQLKALFPESVAQLELTFSREDSPGSYYQYSHGLKKHLGNCQRIAHGHRSRIDIWENGHKSPELEELWAKRWCDIYIGTRSDIKAEPTHNNAAYYHFAYTSQQGPFELTIPQNVCYLIDTDSTVELIAQHFAQATKAERPNSKIRVKAFEGIHKGAIAEL
jgi:6-pyruvoyl-tetrahydropterin synthase